MQNEPLSNESGEQAFERIAMRKLQERGLSLEEAKEKYKVLIKMKTPPELQDIFSEPNKT